jgi:RNA polymerase primary sigma factor
MKTKFEKLLKNRGSARQNSVGGALANQPSSRSVRLDVSFHNTDLVGQPVELTEAPREKNPERQETLGLYLQEIGRMDLVTPEEEIELAARIKRGDEEAREQLIQANLRLVVKIARDYEHVGLPLLDLINEGNIGLMKAVERFDPAKGAKFSTYGAFWIKQRIKLALANQTRTIRVPVHMVDKIHHMRIAAHRLRELSGHEPTDEELGEEMGLSRRKIGRMRRASRRPVSLDAPLGDKDTNTLSDVVEDERLQSPLDKMQDESSISAIRKLVDKLPEREAGILRQRFGLDEQSRMTLEEIGNQQKVTRERIRQLQNRALARLRMMLESLEADGAAATRNYF